MSSIPASAYPYELSADDCAYLFAHQYADLAPPDPADAAQMAPKPMINKKCSKCARELPDSFYSGAQLKKKGKRVCTECHETVQEHQRNLAHMPLTVAGRTDTLQCLDCGANRKRPLMAICGRCELPYCKDRPACLHNHLHDYGRCAALISQPTDKMNAEDCFTDADLDQHLPRLQAETQRRTERIISQRKDKDPSMFKHMFTRADAEVLQLVSLPPSLDRCWWRRLPAAQRSNDLSQRVEDAVFNAMTWIRVLEFQQTVQIFTEHSMAERFTRPTMHASPVGASRESSLFDDHSRFFHKLLRHCIFFRKHADRKMDPSRDFYRYAERDDFGLLLLRGIFDSGPRGAMLEGVAYCTHAPLHGASYLVPLYWRQSYSASAFVVASTAHRGGIRCLLTENGHIVTQPGIVIMGPAFPACGSRSANLHFTDVVFAYSGLVQGNVNRSFCQSDYESQESEFDWSIQAAPHLMENAPGIPSTIAEARRANREKATQARHQLQQQDPTFHFHRALHATLADEWPAKKSLSFIELPQAHTTESELVELLALEELLEESKKDQPDPAALLLIASVEEATGESFASVVESARQRMQRMIGEQMDEHAEIVKRAELRAGKGSQAPSVSASTASSSSTSASSASAAPTPSAAAASSSSSAIVTRPAGASSSSSSSASSAVARTSDSDLWSSAPSWMRDCKGFSELRERGAVKFRKFRKIIRALWSLPQMNARSQSQAGSHVNVHTERGGFTLVEHHTGGAKDTAVPAFARTRVVESLMTAAMAAYSQAPVAAAEI